MYILKVSMMFTLGELVVRPLLLNVGFLPKGFSKEVLMKRPVSISPLLLIVSERLRFFNRVHVMETHVSKSHKRALSFLFFTYIGHVLFFKRVQKWIELTSKIY